MCDLAQERVMCDLAQEMVMCDLAQEMVMWSELHSLAILTRYISGKNVLADQVSLPDKGPSHRMVSSPDIRLHLQGLWMPSHRLVCYKSKRKVTSTHVSASKFHNMETRCLEHLLDNLSAYAFIPSLFSAGFVESNAFNRALIGSHNSILASEGGRRSVGSSDERISRAPLAVENACSASCQEDPSWSGDALSSSVEVSKHLNQKAGFLREVAEVIT